MRLETVVLGIPFNGDGTSPEVENPPRTLREAGLLSRLGELGAPTTDLGDVSIPAADGRRDGRTGILNLIAWQEVTGRIVEVSWPVVRDGSFLVALGGDCSILVGLIGAIRREGRRVGLISLDGHADYRLPSESPTGEPADFPIAVLTGHGPNEITHLVCTPPLLKPSDVVLCGYREPDRIEETTMARLDRKVFAAWAPGRPHAGASRRSRSHKTCGYIST